MLLAVIPLLGAGCISFSSSKADGGLFLSRDRGEKWVQRGAIPSVGGAARTLANTNITTIVQDPQDRNALYVGTDTQGGFYSWDTGNAWWPLGAPLASVGVPAIAVDPRATCTVYAAAGPKVFKTTDCTRSWRSSDFESPVTALAVDPLNAAMVYAGTARGDLLKSSDGGASWRATGRFENRIRTLRAVAAPGGKPPVIVYVATQSDGLRRSMDSGETWVDLRKGMERFPAAFDFRGIAVAGDAVGGITIASKYGILRSVDAGVTWEALTLLTAPNTVDITAVAVNPRNGRELVYATASTFYKTSDGGRSWVSKKLPTTRTASALLMDTGDANTIWMGTLKVKK